MFLDHEITVKGVQTTPRKYLNFCRSLRNLCNTSFDDSTYIYKLIETQLFTSMTTEDRAKIDYELLIEHQVFELRQQTKLRDRKQR